MQSLPEYAALCGWSIKCVDIKRMNQYERANAMLAGSTCIHLAIYHPRKLPKVSCTCEQALSGHVLSMRHILPQRQSFRNEEGLSTLLTLSRLSLPAAAV